MDSKAATTNALRRLGIVLVVTGACLFGSAGTFAWWNAWAFLAAYLVVVGALTLTLFRNSPELVEERRTAGKKAKGWDQVIVPIAGAVLPLIALILAGLDRRFAWTQSIPAWVSAVAIAVVLAGNAFTFWAMQVNRFFSSHVRIQEDRGHVVISSGPYALVRHPGYSGLLVYNLAVPLLLGSLPALWVGAASCAVFVLRTALEDRTLRRELNGYAEYAQKVRYRLIPWVW